MTNLFSKSLRRSLRSARTRQLRLARRLLSQALTGGRALLPAPRATGKGKPARGRVKSSRPATPVSSSRERPPPRSFTCAAGSRDYLLFRPARSRRRPGGLIVMLHGCGQEAADFAAGTAMNAKAGAAGLLVAYPLQPRSANANGCWNWYRPAHQGPARGEPAILAGMTRALMTEFDLDRSRVFVAGLSAGGAMAAVLATTHPELFDAVGIHSGLPAGRARSAADAIALMRGKAPPPIVARPTTANQVRTIIFHGGADRTVHPSNALDLAAGAVPLVEGSRRRRHAGTAGGRRYDRVSVTGADGVCLLESWLIQEAGHAWSGGQPGQPFSDPRGPDASAEMLRFFLRSPR